MGIACLDDGGASEERHVWLVTDIFIRDESSRND